MWMMTDLIKNEMVFQDTRFFLLVVEMNKLEIPDMLLHPGKVFPKSSDGAQQQFISTHHPQLSKEGIMNPSKTHHTQS